MGTGGDLDDERLDRQAGRADGVQQPGSGALAAGLDEGGVLAAMVTLGTLLLEAQLSVTDVRDSLQSVARRCVPGMELRIGVFPSAILLNVGTRQTELGLPGPTALSMRQSSHALRLVKALETGAAGLGDVAARVARVRALTPRRPQTSWILGTALVSVGLAIIFHCPWWSVLTAVLVGGVVGVVTVVMPRIAAASAIMPFVAALVSTLLVGMVNASFDLGGVPLYAVCAPVAILVPGALISNALLELTAEDIITGSARLMYGVIMLGFMQAGILAGASVTHLVIDPNSAALIGQVPPDATVRAAWTAIPPPWFAWAGVVCVAVGVGLALGAGRRLTLLSVFAMLATYAVVSVLMPFVAAPVATGAAACALFIGSRVLERFTVAVPAPIMFQPAFLLLVPGTVGLVAFAAQNMNAAGDALLTFAGLCIGVKAGAVIADGSARVRPRSVARAQGEHPAGC